MKKIFVLFLAIGSILQSCSNGTVTEIIITLPTFTSGPKIDGGNGEQILFIPSVNNLKTIVKGNGSFDSSVNWAVSDGNEVSLKTSTITPEGVLSISADETLEYLIIKAVSSSNSKIIGFVRSKLAYDPQLIKGKWVGKFASVADTITIEDKSVTIRFSNGKFFSYNNTLWTPKRNIEPFNKDEFISGYNITGLIDTSNINQTSYRATRDSGTITVRDNFYYSSDDFGYYIDPQKGVKVSLNLFLSKDKSKLIQAMGSKWVTYEKVK